MRRAAVLKHLRALGAAEREWDKAHAVFRSQAAVLTSRLLHESAVNYVSISDIAYATGWTERRVRAEMRKINMNVKGKRSVQAKQSTQVLLDNASLLGLEPEEMDMMSPLAYLPAGSALLAEAQYELTSGGVSEIEDEEE